jgi:hypothetical protein
MSRHVTHYETKDGKTYRTEKAAGKPAGKNGDSDKPGSDNTNKQPGHPEK